MLDHLAQQIQASQQSAGLPIRLIAIDGYGGSGKTTLAGQLAAKLGAEILHTDDFASYDNPMNWWPRFIHDVIEPVQRGATELSYGRGSWYKTHQPQPVANQPVTPIMILEGVGSSRAEFRRYLSYSIWVDTPLDECRRRGIERDLADNVAGKTSAELQADWDRWHDYEQEYVARDDPKSYADEIVNRIAKAN